MMSLFIEDLNGFRYDLDMLGLKPYNFIIDSLSPRNETEMIEGRDGYVDISETTFEGRTMRASFLLQSISLDEFSTVRNQIFKLFNGKNLFYIVEKRLPDRRWKVRTSGKFTPEKINTTKGMFQIEFISPKAYAESSLSTLSPYTNIPYKFDTTIFKVLNDGDVRIDPRESYLKISFTGVSENLLIRNKTTGDVWQYIGATFEEDTLVMDGIRSFKNSSSIFRDTNKKLICLDLGWNEFEIEGVNDNPFEISFDFYNLYI